MVSIVNRQVREESSHDSALEIAIGVAQLLDSKRAREVKVLDVRALLPITSYFVIAEGGSTRAVRGLADSAARFLRTSPYQRRGVESDSEGRWVCVDYSEVVVHVFDRAAREFYDLEHLWREAPNVAFPPLAAT
ncbi:MAG: ribosome silencing factor [Planctomycetota bacterium]